MSEPTYETAAVSETCEQSQDPDREARRIEAERKAITLMREFMPPMAAAEDPSEWYSGEIVQQRCVGCGKELRHPQPVNLSHICWAIWARSRIPTHCDPRKPPITVLVFLLVEMLFLALTAGMYILGRHVGSTAIIIAAPVVLLVSSMAFVRYSDKREAWANGVRYSR